MTSDTNTTNGAATTRNAAGAEYMPLMAPRNYEEALTQLLFLGMIARGPEQKAKMSEQAEWMETLAAQLNEPTWQRCLDRAIVAADDWEAELPTDECLMWTLSVVATADPHDEFACFDFVSEGGDPQELLEQAVTLASAVRHG